MVARNGIFIGTAGWTVRRAHQSLFAPGASHLARYSALLNAVEINSSFYRPHRPATYAKWASIVPSEFHFAVKMPRAITHYGRLSDVEELLEGFLGECAALGASLGPILCKIACNNDPLRGVFRVQFRPPKTCCVSVLSFGPCRPGRAGGDDWRGQDRGDTPRLF